MRRLYVTRPLASVLVSLMALGVVNVAGAQPSASAEAPAAQAAQPAQSGESAASGASLEPTQERAFVDGIAAVVNQNVITLRQLDVETRSAQEQLQRQNIPVPDHETLQRQVLQRMITQELERQEAERLGIEVTDEHVQHAVQTIAERNQLSVDQLRHEVEASGVAWDMYLKDLRQEVLLDMLRQRAVDSHIIISDAEVDAFLRTEGRQMSLMSSPQTPQAAQPAPQQQQAQPRVMGLAHILVAVPEGASSSQVAELRQKAESLLARVKGGADFAGVAAASSDGPQALDGGDMGVRPLEGWPDLFIEATRGLAEGQISDIIQSGNGFHILKVTSLGAPGSHSGPAPGPVTSAGAPQSPAPAPAAQGPMLVTQTHARHILIKTSQVMSDEQAEQRLLQLRERLAHGEDFADLAKRYSEDASAPQGGDLGWLTPGETVAPFQQAMDALEPGQISAPVRSQFGWHLIQVLERRTKDMEDEFKRMQARQILFQRRVEPALEDWLNQLRGQAYIENRLDPQSNRNRRR